MKTLLLLTLLAFAGARAAELTPWELEVGGVKREALVYAPASAHEHPTPLVFVFHGHGGSAQNAERMFGLDRNWPEAISVYPQGLNTPGRLTDPEGQKPGWQSRAGAEGNRDLEFFDALLVRLRKEFQVDATRIYCTGHSNGGGFTYLLWAERGDIFAAMAPSAAVAAESVPKLKPKPALHLAGEKDTLVRFEWQQRMMDAVRKLNGCAPEGTPWAPNATLYPSKTGTPFITFIHPGGHVFAPEAAPLIAKFFREQPPKPE